GLGYLSCSTCAVTNVSNMANGTYQLQVEVTDNLGAKTKDTVQIFETGSILPTGLVYFKGRNLEKNNILQWATSTEFNNDHFDLERSGDGRGFQTIARIAGTGSSISKTDYNYTDLLAPDQLSYYRLRQVDLAGSFKYSPIITIN